MIINLVSGVVLVGVLVSVLVFQALDREDWMALAGSTLWIKLFLSFALGRHAHGNAAMLAEAGKKKRAENLRKG